MITILLHNVRALDPETFHIKSGDVIVQSSRSQDSECPAPVDGQGMLAMPALVNGHHHVYSALSLGMPQPAAAPVDFHERLKKIWWRLDRALDLPMIRASARVAAAASAIAGATVVIDHHSSPNTVEGALDVIAEEFEEIGVGYVPAIELSDRNGKAAIAAGLRETDLWLNSGRPGLVGLHASFTVGESLLSQAVELARKHGTGIHVHTAEDMIDQDVTLHKYGCRVIERYQRAGVLDLPGTILAHCLHLSDQEWHLLGRAGAWVVVNSESNQNNGVGSFSSGMTDNSRIMLGTDGMHSDMIRSARAAYLQGRRAEKVSPQTVWERLRNAHRYLTEYGMPPGHEQDTVLLDYQPHTDVHSDNWPGHFFYGMESQHVHTVVAGGRVIVRDHELLTADVREIRLEARAQARRLWAALADM